MLEYEGAAQVRSRGDLRESSNKEEWSGGRRQRGEEEGAANWERDWKV